MKYCINYNSKKVQSAHLNNFNEITIKFRPSDKSLVQFLLLHTEQRTNIYIHDNQDFIENNRIKLFDAIVDEYPEINIAFKLQDYHSPETQEVYKIISDDSRNFKFFFQTHANDFDIFYGLLNLKPSDIYVTDILGFNLKQCAVAAHEAGVQIRVFPNVAQSTWKTTSDISKFFIRPNDIDIYEPYVDVLEFWGLDRQTKVYYDIYAKDKDWHGLLNEIIIDFNDQVNNEGLPPQFGFSRMGCGKRCLKGYQCRMCETAADVAKSLSAVNLKFKKNN